MLARTIAKKIMLRTARIDVLRFKIGDYLDSKPYLGYGVEKKLEELRNESKISIGDQIIFRNFCKRFLLSQHKQIQQRLPDNVDALEKMSLPSVSNTLKACKETLEEILSSFKVPAVKASLIESQYNKFNLVKWSAIKETVSF